jgi:O-antigen/teichoic acid export membrane protein
MGLRNQEFLKNFMMLFCRAGTLASKFILLMFLAKYVSLDELGVYSLVTISITYLAFLLGFDFYTYSNRELLKIEDKEWSGIINSQFVFYSISYTLSIPVILAFFYFDMLPWEYLLYFYALLILEHLSQELMRLLIVMLKPMQANLQLFIRSGGWILLFIIYYYITGDISLSTLFIFWIFADILAIAFSIACFDKDKKFYFKFSAFNLAWVTKGLRVALPLLVSTLALRGIYVVDRYILKYDSDIGSVGIYSFYSNMSNALISFVDAVIVVQFYPKLVRAYSSSNIDKYNEVLRSFKRKMISFCAIIFILLASTFPIVTLYLGKKQLIENISVYYILLVSAVIYSIGLVYHFELYAQGKDKSIIASSVISFAIGLVIMIYLSKYGMLGIALGQLLATSLVLITKKTAVERIKRGSNVLN